MTFLATIYRILIVTPPDATAESRVIHEMISSWNNKHSANMRAFLLPVLFHETNSVPERTDKPKTIPYKNISKDCDVLIGVFWTRIGADNGYSESSTIDVINEFLKAGKPLMIYFSSAPVIPSSVDLKQYENLMKFMSDCQKIGIVNRYDSIPDFQGKLNTDISSKISSIHKTKETETSRNIGETTKEESIDIISNRFCDVIERYNSSWTSEKISQPMNLDEGRKILKNFTKEITSLGVPLARIFSKETMKNIAQIISNLQILQKHRLYLDEKSYNDFWKLGDDIFASLDAIVSNVRKGASIIDIDNNMEKILVELSKIEKRFFEPIPPDTIAKTTDMSITETNHMLNKLLKTGLISQILSGESQTRYFMSNAGRKLLVERGLK